MEKSVLGFQSRIFWRKYLYLVLAFALSFEPFHFSPNLGIESSAWAETSQAVSSEASEVASEEGLYLGPVEDRPAEMPTILPASSGPAEGTGAINGAVSGIFDPLQDIVIVTRDGAQIPIPGIKEGSREHHRYMSLSPDQQKKFAQRRIKILQGLGSFLTLVTRAGKGAMHFSGLYWLSQRQWTMARIEATKALGQKVMTKLKSLAKIPHGNGAAESEEGADLSGAPIRAEFLEIFNRALITAMPALASPRVFHVEVQPSLSYLYGVRGAEKTNSKLVGALTVAIQLSFDSYTGEIMVRVIPKYEVVEKVLTFAAMYGPTIRGGVAVTGNQTGVGEVAEPTTSEVVSLPGGPLAVYFNADTLFFGFAFSGAAPGVFPFSEAMGLVTKAIVIKSFKVVSFTINPQKWAEGLTKMSRRLMQKIPTPVSRELANAVFKLRNLPYMEYTRRMLEYHRVRPVTDRVIALVGGNARISCRQVLHETAL